MNLTMPLSFRSFKPGGLLLKSLAVGALMLSLTGCIPIPVIEFFPSAPVVGGAVTFDGTGTIVTNVPADTVAVSYRWDFGDGTKASGSTTEHAYETAGTYDVTLRVIDSAGRVGEATESVTVTADTTSTTTTQ